LFRRVPAAGPPHVSAAKLLAALLPVAVGAAGGAEAASALTTVRKFLLRCSGLPEHDATPGRAAAGHAVALLERQLAGVDAAGTGDSDLPVFATAQLLPGLQVG
jgi:hypothetical protein